MMVLQDGMVLLENVVIVETLGLQVCQALRVPLALPALLALQEMQDREEIQVLGVLLDHLVELGNVAYMDPKDLAVTKVIMETEEIEVRRVTEASLVFRVFLDLLVQMVNKAVLESLDHLAREVLQAQLVLQVKKETLGHLGLLVLLVCGAVLEKQDLRVLLVSLVYLVPRVPLATLQLLLGTSWGTMMRACQIHSQSLLKIRRLLMTKTKLTQGSMLP